MHQCHLGRFWFAKIERSSALVERMGDRWLSSSRRLERAQGFARDAIIGIALPNDSDYRSR
jgi:hypothetical protein